MSGSASRNSFGSSFDVRYVATPIGFEVSRNDNSTILSLFDLQRIMPMDGFSSGSFTYSSRAER